MTREKAEKRAVALWQLATVLRHNLDPKLNAIGGACDKQAMRYAEQAGIQYDQVRDRVDETAIDIGAFVGD